MRREFNLPEEDLEILAGTGLDWEAVLVPNPGDPNVRAKWIIFPTYKVSDPYNHQTVNAAIRLPPNYPDEDIDMVYFHPPLALKNGKTINNLSEFPLDGKTYQQWSRHRTQANPWRPGVDNIGTHLIQVDNWLERETRK